MLHRDPARRFPCFLYHPALAKDGKLFKSEDELDAITEEGWVNTPAAFAPGYKAPSPVAAEDEVPELAPAGFEMERYPCWRYKIDPATQTVIAGAERLVKTAADDAELDRAVWKNSPDPKHWAPDHPVARTMPSLGGDAPAPRTQPASTPAAETAPADTPVPSDAPVPQPSTATSEDEAEKIAEKNRQDATALYSSGISDVLKKLEGCEDTAVLDRVLAFELSNPAGPRNGIVNPVRAALKKLRK